MKVTRIYTTADGESHFEDLGEIVLESKGNSGRFSPEIDAKNIFLHEFAADFHSGWSPTPIKSAYVILLAGKQEIAVSDGHTQTFSQNDLLLIEDSHGKGHCTRAVEPGKSLTITLE